LDIPYDIDAYHPGVPLPGWPVARREVDDLNRDLKHRLIAFSRHNAEKSVEPVLVAALPQILSQTLSLGQAALTAMRCRDVGRSLVYSSPSLTEHFLNCRNPDGKMISGRFLDRMEKSLATDSLWLPRKIAHGILANQGIELPWRPLVAVLNQTSLLRDALRQEAGRRFRFLTPARLFRGVVPEPTGETARRIEEAADGIAQTLQSVLVERSVTADPVVADAARRGAVAWLALAYGYGELLRQRWRRPPPEIWTGTGGNLFVRLARQHVRAAGGTATGFDHGGAMILHRDPAMFHLTELAAVDRFVTETPHKAEIYRTGIDAGLLPDPRPRGDLPEIASAPAGRGQFQFARLGGAGNVRRVMVVTTAFVGEAQHPWLPLLPDPVYADWLARLIDGLADAGFEVLCKQHPEGVRDGRPLEVSPRATYLGGRFAEHLDKADAFIFDYPATTTLWEAMCTDKPVAFVDLGLAEWNPTVRASFERRCVVVPGGFDSNNLPQVDFETLANALRHADAGDDSFARQHLIGEARS